MAPHHTRATKLTACGVEVRTVACGGFFTAAVVAGGGMVTFGANECGQLGHGGREAERAPRLVRALEGTPIAQVACGACHLVALSETGALHVCGRNGDGELGTGDLVGANAELPRRLPLFGDPGVCTVAVACGSFHTAAVVRLSRRRLGGLVGERAAAAVEERIARRGRGVGVRNKGGGRGVCEGCLV